MDSQCSMVQLQFLLADGKGLFIEEWLPVIGFIDYYKIIKRQITQISF